MVTKDFAIRSEPHVATIGEHRLTFAPEANGSELLDGYAKLKAAQASVDVEKDPAAAKKILRALRVFLASLMLPESADLFLTVDVLNEEGVRVRSFKDEAEAEEFAASSMVGAKVVERLPLPQRVLTELLEWIIEVLGGGARPTGS